MKNVPTNRLVALLAGPISTLAGLIAGYLATHAVGLHFGHDQIAKALTFVATAGITAGVHYAAAHKWLDGWQRWESLVTSPGAKPRGVRTPPAVVPAVAAVPPVAPTPPAA